jgi:hypothetical protein
MSSLIESFFDGREALLEQIRTFERNHKLRLIDRLKAAYNEVHFHSTITEIHFGIFFSQIATSIKYESSIENKSPDWIFTSNGQTILAEVVRLNPSSTDKKELDFDDKLMDILQTIRIGCLLYFDYDDNDLVRSEIDFIECKRELELWLSVSRQVGETTVICNSIKIEFVAYSDNVDHVCLCGGGGAINFDYRRLNSEKSTLVLKAQKYSKLIENYQFPYIICLYLDFHTWFDKKDVYRTLYGSSTEHWEDAKFYSHLIKDALYYSKRSLFKDVSGVLLRQKDEYTYFHNYSNNKLNKQNEEFFKKWQHPHN